jgi:LysM repeat protein
LSASYTVRAGDTLSRIARDVLGDVDRWPEIVAANGLDDAALIYPGQVLALPEDARASAQVPVVDARRGALFSFSGGPMRPELVRLLWFAAGAGVLVALAYGYATRDK